jgi:hypothetical protein
MDSLKAQFNQLAIKDFQVMYLLLKNISVNKGNYNTPYINPILHIMTQANSLTPTQ